MNSQPKSVMTSAEIRSRFLEFFKKRGHAILPSASLVTTDEKGVTNPTLFNTAGMQPLIPYLLGQPYLIAGQEVKRLADAQKCVRTVDIDDIGDKTHATFFEMLGNWSLGDYFKKEAINWSFEFLTDKKEGLGLDPARLYVTVFEGDEKAEPKIPRDDEAADIWRDIFKKNKIEGERIFYMPASMNWWEAGDNGPCGPDTEMYYDIVGEKGKFGGKGITREQFLAADAARDVVEVWNDVFMQYEKRDGKIISTLPKPSVDTGAGLERLTMTIQGVDNIYDTDLLKPVMEKIREFSKTWELKSARIVADHIKAAVFLIADGVTPSNTDRGYVLRKLVRRAVRHADKLGFSEHGQLDVVAKLVTEIYKNSYREIHDKRDIIIAEILREETRFRETLQKGMKEFEKGVDAFTLFSSYGFPLELTLELAKEKGISIDTKDFEEKFKKHQDLSRAGAEQKFKGGLADASDPVVVRYHTATHLLHQALHDVLGDSVMQKGSNITPERLRFDFVHGAKMTDDEKKRVENIVNKKIEEALPVQQVTMPKAEAEKTGARHFFGDKYGDEVSIYFVGKDLASAYSKEFCGGPHVKNTSELAGPSGADGSLGRARFKILKEEAVSQGVRRIKAVLQ
jgi:alanyl-tRNA synthetase